MNVIKVNEMGNTKIWWPKISHQWRALPRNYFTYFTMNCVFYPTVLHFVLQMVHCTTNNCTGKKYDTMNKLPSIAVRDRKWKIAPKKIISNSFIIKNLLKFLKKCTSVKTIKVFIMLLSLSYKISGEE